MPEDAIDNNGVIWLGEGSKISVDYLNYLPKNTHTDHSRHPLTETKQDRVT
ncbi:MAG: hypothetical protein ACI9C4_000941 [Paraglaciecola sp.]|jgi:hypothetical protein